MILVADDALKRRTMRQQWAEDQRLLTPLNRSNCLATNQNSYR